MIPKTIHYFWFGKKEKSKLIKKCINSWKKQCPDYRIIEWNEDNFDVNMNGYTSKCYSEHKFAFLSDYARLYVVNKYGGIYLDTDVELVKPLDTLLSNKAFFAFETEKFVATGLGFGSECHGSVIESMLHEYDELLDGRHDMVGCPILNTKALVNRGLIRNGKQQMVDEAVIYPIDFFNPYDPKTGTLNMTEQTYGIHWYSASWLPWPKKMKHWAAKNVRHCISRIKNRA